MVLYHHAVFGWSMWSRAIIWAVVVFTFALNSALEYWQQQDEVAILYARRESQDSSETREEEDVSRV